MKALLLLPIFMLIASGVGRLLLDRLAVLVGRRLEVFVFSTAIGIAIAAYGVYAIGLCGQLTFFAVTVWWLLLALVGIGGTKANVRDFFVFVQSLRTASKQDSSPANFDYVESRLERAVCSISILTLLLFGLLALIACYRPPGAIEWDVVSYHLADPKVFLQNHRIFSLPTEHHSNFPFLMEMLYTVGLLYDGYALANMFHLTTAVLTVLGLIAFASRMLGRVSGYVAAVVFATTPLVFWEATVAYIDIGLGLYTTLAAFAAISVVDLYRNKSAPLDSPGNLDFQRNDFQGNQGNNEKASAGTVDNANGWLVLCGLLMGAALGTKYLALIPMALTGALLLIGRVSLRGVAIYVGCALAVASPWYLKNSIVMHNPVYPFASSVFKDSKYWSADRAALYTAEQQSFGDPHRITNASSALNLVKVPWRLLTNSDVYFNAGERASTAYIGGLYAAFCCLLPFVKQRSCAANSLFALGALQIVGWFFISQVGRYLIAILPLLALSGGYAVAQSLRGSEEQNNSGTGTNPLLSAVLRCIVCLSLAGQTAMTLWILFLLPTGGSDARDLTIRAATEPRTDAALPDRPAQPLFKGMLPSALSIPETLPFLTDDDARTKSLSKRLDIYDAEIWLNANTKSTDGVVLYEDVRGFYLDRPYLWGNGEHSSYIPYETLTDGAALTEWLRAKGYRYALLNLKWSPANTTRQPIPDDLDTVNSVLRSWYPSTGATPWRSLVGDAIQRGVWVPVAALHGCVVLRIG